MAAVRRAHDARGAIDGAAEIVAVTVLDGPHVNAASNRDRNAFRGGWIDKRALQRNRGFNGVRRIGEHGEHAVAHHLDDRAAAFHDRRAAERVVTHQCRTHPVRVLFPQPGAALDIGEEKRDFGGPTGGHAKPSPAARKAPACYARAGATGGQIALPSTRLAGFAIDSRRLQRTWTRGSRSFFDLTPIHQSNSHQQFLVCDNSAAEARSCGCLALRFDWFHPVRC